MPSRLIWQYWETVGDKPAFVDGLHAIAVKNAGAEVILVTPQTLQRYLPTVPPQVLAIREIAHKADMIRAMLVREHGGMWLDSDAVVLRPLGFIFDLLEANELVCFNDGGALADEGRPWVRVNCFASRPHGRIVTEWVRQQHAKFPRTEYGWEEIGSALLHPICVAHRASVRTLPFETICPVRWDQVELFGRRDMDAGPILRDCHAVMLSNASLKLRAPWLRALTTDEIAAGDYLLSAIMRHALQDQGSGISDQGSAAKNEGAEA